VGKIPDFERELKLKSDQLLRLREDRGEEIIKLQQQLESEKRARAAIVGSLGRLMGAVSDEVIVEITNGIQSTLDDSVIEVGAPEATKIKVDTGAFAGVVTGSTSTLNKATTDFIAQLKVQVAAWQAKESQTSNQIDQKKQELLQHGIWLDMPFIQKLVSDEARAKENVKNLKTWVPELARLRQEHTGLAVTPDIHSAEARVGG
jgi:predicted ATP-dependent Lon-type protease